MKGYSRVEWQEFRAEVIRLDGDGCVKCNRGKASGAILQVHHKVYIPGLKPWEYPHKLCETLCRACHAKEHGKIVPTEGWSLIGYDDLGASDGTCEYCGTEIRYVFMIEHPKWNALEVGEICCVNLTSTGVASDHMLNVRRNNERRKRFVSSSRWTGDLRGKSEIVQEHVKIAIVPINDVYRIEVNGTRGKLEFKNPIDARVKVFTLLESGQIAKYIGNRAPCVQRGHNNI